MFLASLNNHLKNFKFKFFRFDLTFTEVVMQGRLSQKQKTLNYKFFKQNIPETDLFTSYMRPYLKDLLFFLKCLSNLKSLQVVFKVSCFWDSMYV